jgi:hypothetical protein
MLPSALGHTLVLLSHKPYYYYYLHLLTNFCIFIVEVATKQNTHTHTHTEIADKILGSHYPPSLLAAKTNKQTPTHQRVKKEFQKEKKKKKKLAKCYHLTHDLLSPSCFQCKLFAIFFFPSFASLFPIIFEWWIYLDLLCIVVTCYQKFYLFINWFFKNKKLKSLFGEQRCHKSTRV